MSKFICKTIKVEYFNLSFFLSFVINEFPEIIRNAYEYVVLQTKKFLQEPLINWLTSAHICCCGQVHTTPGQNHAILVLLPVGGKRAAMPLTAPSCQFSLSCNK